MMDPRLSRMARILIRYSTRVRKGDRVSISGETAAIPLMEQLYLEALKAGAHPHVDVSIPSLSRYFYKFAGKEQLAYVSPLAEAMEEGFDVAIVVMSEENPHHLSGVDPRKQALRHKSLSGLSARQVERMVSGELRSCTTLYPTNAYASAAEMALEDFEDFVFKACYVDHPDPLARWRQVHRYQDRIIAYLSKRSSIHLQAPGTDLRFSYEGRRWMNCDGLLNFPDGEIFTCPIEDSVEGVVEFTYPACLYGREVEGVRLVFEKGRVVEASARKNEEFLLEMLDTDPGARRLGEFAIGTNKGVDRFTKNVLFDEKIAGTCHLAVGLSAPGCGGTNHSAIHWDMVCDLRRGGCVEVDGKVILKNGRFLRASWPAPATRRR